jgi:glutathione synthase/RimK-type ligase-like ATP-grasp enzyme
VPDTLPSRLLETAGVFLHRFKLDYGAIDIVESHDGEFYVVDVNMTPFWGDERQAGLTEHLRLGFSKAIQE